MLLHLEGTGGGVWVDPAEVVAVRPGVVTLRGGRELDLEAGQHLDLLHFLSARSGAHEIVPLPRPNYGEVPEQVRGRLPRGSEGSG